METKIIKFILILGLVFSLASCQKGDNDSDKPDYSEYNEIYSNQEVKVLFRSHDSSVNFKVLLYFSDVYVYYINEPNEAGTVVLYNLEYITLGEAIELDLLNHDEISNLEFDNQKIFIYKNQD